MLANSLGNLLILLAFAFNALVGISFFMVSRGKDNFDSIGKKAYHMLVAVISMAVILLYYLFFTDAYYIRYIFEYADSSLPFFYTLSAFWGGQEGTYLLWMFMNVIFGYIILHWSGRYKANAMIIYSTVNLFFLFLMMKLSPFALMSYVPLDGAGLNPLLQDPWMVIHPPIIFLGYSLAGIPFSIAIAALIQNDYTNWIKRSFPWVAISSLMLAAGNIIGGYWAYKTLGWGGFWAWDPVENSSFVPWFISLALIHGLIIEKRNGALRKTNILMTSLLFIMVIYGTFLTRSGVLADFSVHSFVDLGINQYLVVFLVLYTLMVFTFFARDKLNRIFGTSLFGLFVITTFLTGGNDYVGAIIAVYILFSLIVTIPNLKGFENKPLAFNIFNKEFILFGAMFLLFTFTMIVLFWTSLPIFTTIFTDTPRAADLSTYNSFALPFAVIFSMLLAVAPLVNFNSFKISNLSRKLIIVVPALAVIGFGLFWYLLGTSLVFAFVFVLYFSGLFFYLLKPEMLKALIPGLTAFVLTIFLTRMLDVTNYMYIFLFASAAMVVVSNLISVIKHMPDQLRTAGAQFSHFGFGLLIIGTLASTAFSTNERIAMFRGETRSAYGMNISYEGMENRIEYPHNKLIISYEQDGSVYDARPELYFSKKTEAIMRKPFVNIGLLEDYYFSPEEIKDIGIDKGLVLFKEKPRRVGDYTFTYYDIDKTQSTETNFTSTMTAYIEVIDKGDTIPLFPSLNMTELMGHGEGRVAAVFGDNDQYEMTINEIIDVQDAITVFIPGISDRYPQDRLIMDVSKKPIINFVWFGSIFIMFSGIVVFFRRKAELN